MVSTADTEPAKGTAKQEEATEVHRGLIMAHWVGTMGSYLLQQDSPFCGFGKMSGHKLYSTVPTFPVWKTLYQNKVNSFVHSSSKYIPR